MFRSWDRLYLIALPLLCSCGGTPLAVWLRCSRWCPASVLRYGGSASGSTQLFSNTTGNTQENMQTLEQKIHSAQTAYGIAPEQAEFPFRSVAHLLAERSTLAPLKPYIVYYDERDNRSEYSYAAFADCVQRTVSLLFSLGLQRGDRIATAAHNHPDTIVLYVAAWAAGMCVVPLNMSEDNDRLRYIVENSGAKVLFCREDYLPRLDEFMPVHKPVVVPVYDNVATRGGFHEAIAALMPADFSDAYALNDECLIVYTSGTTGNPKGVVLVQRNLMADAASISSWHGIHEHNTMMCVLPVHHVNGTIVTHVTPLYAGATVVLNRKFQTDRFFPRIKAEKVDIVSVVPTLLAFLLEAKANSLGVVEAGFRHIICGAGPLTCELARQFEDYYRIPIVHGYGLSETTCYSCFLPVDLSEEEHTHWMQDYGFPSIGVPIPHNEMAIHDEHGNALGEMERGEIVARGSNVMKGYFNNIDANEKAFTYGWFRSGDEGFFKRDAQGRPYFFITGRLKELIIRGGVNIAPLEIDEVLAQAPGVKAAICVGFENDFYGEEVGALVIPRDGETPSEEAIIAYCAEHLPFHKIPKVVLFTDALPVTSTGKYQRNKVKHLFSQWKPAQFRKSKQ